MPATLRQFIQALGLKAIYDGADTPQGLYRPVSPELAQEFELAKAYFQRYGTRYAKLARTDKFRARYIARHGEASPIPSTTKSFYSINGIIVCTLPGADGLIGQGTSGKVQFAYGMDGRIYVLKKELMHKTALREEAAPDSHVQQELESELTYSATLGQMVGHRARGGRVEDFTDEISSNRMAKADYGDARVQQHYILMPYLGETLSSHIRQGGSTYDKSQRFSLAVKLFWSVYRLHQGYASHDGRVIAHRDIKPENFVFDDSLYATVKAIDYGSASSDIDELGADDGSPAYKPADFAIYTSQAQDIFAALRTVYLPPSFDMYRNKNVLRCEEESWLLSDSDYDSIPSFLREQFLDTADGKLKPGLSGDVSANLPAALFALLTNPNLDCVSLINTFRNNQDALNTVIYLSFAELINDFDTEELSLFLREQNKVAAISALSPMMHELSSKLMAEVFRIVRETDFPETNPLYKALCEIAARDPDERFMILDIIEKNSALTHQGEVFVFLAQASPSLLLWLTKHQSLLSYSGTLPIDEVGIFLNNLLLLEACEQEVVFKFFNVALEAGLQDDFTSLTSQVGFLRLISALNPESGDKDKVLATIKGVKRTGAQLSAKAFTFFFHHPSQSNPHQHRRVKGRLKQKRMLSMTMKPKKSLTLPIKVELLHYLKQQRQYYLDKYRKDMNIRGEAYSLPSHDKAIHFKKQAKKHYRKLKAIRALIKKIHNAPKGQERQAFDSWLEQHDDTLSIETYRDAFKKVGGTHHLIAHCQQCLALAPTLKPKVSRAKRLERRQESFRFFRQATLTLTLKQTPAIVAREMVMIDEDHFTDAEERQQGASLDEVPHLA